MPDSDLRRAIETVRQLAGASGITTGTILIAVWLLGYRQVVEPADLLLPRTDPSPTGDLPPTPRVDEIFQRMS